MPSSRYIPDPSEQMSYFLLVYNQHRGLESIEEYPDDAGDAAVARRLELQRANHGRTEMEVVLLGAPSRQALERTHGRYFKSIRELAAPVR
jgi:hypothetical protein